MAPSALKPVLVDVYIPSESVDVALACMRALPRCSSAAGLSDGLRCWGWEPLSDGAGNVLDLRWTGWPAEDLSIEWEARLGPQRELFEALASFAVRENSRLVWRRNDWEFFYAEWRFDGQSLHVRHGAPADVEGPLGRLVSRDGERVITLRAGERVLVGRGTMADVRIDEPTISRRHALFRNIGGQLFVEDAGTAGGIYRNDKRIGGGRCALALGDELILGTYRFTVTPVGEAPRPRTRLSDVDDPAGDGDSR